MSSALKQTPTKNGITLSNPKQEIITPFLRWAGSKRKTVHQLSLFWDPDYIRYIEPFAGSASLFFAINPKKAIIADTNQDLINAYKQIKKVPELIFNELNKIPRNKQAYYAIRALREKQLSKFERAVRFIYLNRNCFNGIYRTNLQGEFNVPMGKKNGDYLPLQSLIECSKALQNAKLKVSDFESTMNIAKGGDLIYLDPPYLVENRRIFREYGANSFRAEDIDRLEDALVAANSKGAHFVLSYADCRESRKIAKSWNSFRTVAKRTIASSTKARRNSYELVITNISRIPSFQ